MIDDASPSKSILAERKLCEHKNRDIMRLLAVGDIHGHLDKLTRLMDIVAPKQDDRMIFLGDYIDRGPDSPGVIKYLIEFGKHYPQTVFIGGNHDLLLLNVLQEFGIIQFPCRSSAYIRLGEVPTSEYNPEGAFLRNGGNITVQQYGGDLSGIPKSHINFLENCLLYHEEKVGQKTYLFVHAGVLPGRPLEQQDPDDLLWIRDAFFCHGAGVDGDATNFGLGGRIIVHGHSPSSTIPGNHPYRISVDSGVYQDPETYKGRGKLTCCNVVTREIWQV